MSSDSFERIGEKVSFKFRWELLCFDLLLFLCTEQIEIRSDRKKKVLEKAEPERRIKRRNKKRNFLKELKLKIERFFFLGERNRNKEKQFTLYNIEGCFIFLNSIVILFVMKLNDQLITANT